MNWRIWLAGRLRQLAGWLAPVPAVTTISGPNALLAFHPVGRDLGYPVYDVVSRRGGFSLGTIKWSNQWGRPRFAPHSEAVFDQQCVAEIYAKLREMSR